MGYIILILICCYCCFLFLCPTPPSFPPAFLSLPISISVSLFLKINLFYLFLAVLGLRCCARAFSSCSERGLLFVAVHGLLIAVASLVVEHGVQARGLQQLWRTGFVALWHVGSSRTRARTHVPCIGRQILNHGTTREVPISSSKTLFCLES